MKKSIALILSIVMLALSVFTFAGCRKLDKDYTGTTLNLYLSDMPTTFDPMKAYLDNSGSAILSLIYEGLFKFDEDGDIVNGIAKSYKWISQDDAKNEYILEIELKDTAWSDGTSVSANDFVFAWRRILDPSNASEAASMLYQIKNARAIKEGQCSKYDLGAYPVDNKVLRIQFESKPNLDLFFNYLASPALVPMRDDAVDKIDEWDTQSSIILANGPFYLKTFNISDGIMRLERNQYYMRDVETDVMDKYVTPYRLVVNIGLKTVVNKDGKSQTVEYSTGGELNAYLWDNGDLKYYGNIYLKDRNNFTDKAEIVDSLSTHTYYFNTKNKLFSDPKVRQALSLAIDREDLIKNTVVFGKAAGGIIPSKVSATVDNDKKSFREEESGTLISYNLDEAKKLLKEAGVSSGSFSITVKKDDEASLAVAEYCKAVWEKLGFKVEIKPLGYFTYSSQSLGYDNMLVDFFTDCYNARGESISYSIPVENKEGEVTKTQDFKVDGYDVIAVDLQQQNNDAFSTLAPFSKNYSGGSFDLSVQQGDYVPITHCTGYDSKDYDDLIQSAFEETDLAKRAKILHQAEELLMQDMPVMPLFEYQNAFVKSKDIKGLSLDWFGDSVFTKMHDKTFKYDPKDKEAEDTIVAPVVGTEAAK